MQTPGMERRPPVNTLSLTQIERLEIGIGISSGLSIAGSLLIVGYIVIKLVRQYRARRNPVAVQTGLLLRHQTDFYSLSDVEKSSGPAREFDLWLLLWFSELLVLNLGLADLGSALWYFLQLRVLNITCNNALAFFGSIFEPASVLCVTLISLSLLLLLRNSLILQTRAQMQRKLVALTFSCFFISWTLPLILAVIYYATGQYGQDSVYCWLSPEHSLFSTRLFSYYIPIMLCLLVNIVLVISIAYTNKVHKLGLSKLALLWIPVSLVCVWTIPAISTAWASLTGGEGSSVPFILVFLSATLLPSMGLWNAILYVILLGRARKIVERTKRFTKGFEDDDGDAAFAVDEVKLRVFGERVTWYFAE